jgi:anti-anti-sigma factor
VRKDTYPVQWIGQQALVALPEYIDVSNAGQIREELLAVLNRGAEALIADMTATISCDHAGADAVARAYRRAAASRTQLRLVVTSGSVLQMLGMTGVGRLVPVYPSVEAALAARLPAAYPRPDRSVKLAEPDERDKTGLDVGVEIALLDRNGVIAWVNQAWRAFAASNGGDPARIGPGVSYLQVCAAAEDDPAAGEVAAAIRAALAGDLPGPMTVVVPCHSAAAERWFDVLISSRLDNQGRCMGVAVTLSLARSRPRASPVRPGRPGWSLKAAPGPGGPEAGSAAVITQGVLWKMIDAIGDGVALTDDGGTLVLANRPLEEMFGYLPGELTGQPVERLIPAHLQASHRGHLAAYAHAPRARPMGAGAPLTGLRRDGSAFPAEISLRPLPTAHGRFALAVVRDLTAASQQGHRSQELLDLVVTALYHVGLSLKDVGDLPPGLGRPRIDGALDVIDHTISRIREAAFADRDPKAEGDLRR